MLKPGQSKGKGELDEQLREYINEWRKQRSAEEDELKRLKEKQAKRKEIRAEQEKKLAQQKKEEEEKLRKAEAEKRAAEEEEKRKRLEEAEKKRQEMMQAQKEKQQASGKGGKGAVGGGGANVQDARKEMTKTKEQLEEEKRISLSIRIKPLDVDAMDTDELQAKAKELWETIVRLETEKYDLEERQKRQDYDVSIILIIIFWQPCIQYYFCAPKMLSKVCNAEIGLQNCLDTFEPIFTPIAAQISLA